MNNPRDVCLQHENNLRQDFVGVIDFKYSYFLRGLSYGSASGAAVLCGNMVPWYVTSGCRVTRQSHFVWCCVYLERRNLLVCAEGRLQWRSGGVK